MLDYILNGQIHGEAADRLAACDFDPGALRPFLWKGQTWATLQNGFDDNGEPVYETVQLQNTVATLTDLQWQQIDDRITPVARQRLQLVAALEGAGLTYNVPGGMGSTVLLTQSISDTNDAQMNMDAVVDAENDRPLLDMTGIPLPIINKEFFFTARELAVSRNRGRGSGATAPLDLTNATNSARKIGEFTEKLFVGTGGSYSYGGYSLYGLINYPYRLTKTITAPSAPGWTPATTLNELLEMVKQLQDASFFGPYTVFYGRNWMPYLENDYSTAKGDNTVMERLAKTSGISRFVQLDYLNRANFDMILVQMTDDVIRVVNAMPLTTVQWDTHGGMRKFYKMMQIKVPQFRRTYAGTSGILHGASA